MAKSPMTVDVDPEVVRRHLYEQVDRAIDSGIYDYDIRSGLLTRWPGGQTWAKHEDTGLRTLTLRWQEVKADG
jgi:hypothetical protein